MGYGFETSFDIGFEPGQIIAKPGDDVLLSFAPLGMRKYNTK